MITDVEHFFISVIYLCMWCSWCEAFFKSLTFNPVPHLHHPPDLLVSGREWTFYYKSRFSCLALHSWSSLETRRRFLRLRGPRGPSLFTHSGEKSAAKVSPFPAAPPTIHIEYAANARKSYFHIALKACTFFSPSSLRQLKRSSG